MASFIKGTTPTFSITLEGGVLFTGLGNVFFRLSQGDIVLNVTPEVSEDGLTATFKLTQEQTLGFETGNIQCQLMGVLGLENEEVVQKSEIFNILAKPSLFAEAVHNEPQEEGGMEEGGEGAESQGQSGNEGTNENEQGEGE